MATLINDSINMRISPFLIITIIVGCTLMAAFLCLGATRFWQLWNIPIMDPYFADLRSITHSAKSISMGLDPMISNPGDPWARAMNYPRIWQYLPQWGVTAEHTLSLGIFTIMTFVLGLNIMLYKADLKLSIIMLIGILSPATVLGIERANIDLFIFFLTSVSVFLLARHQIVSTLMVLFAFSLKIFPIFSLLMLVRFEPRKVVILGALVLIFCSIYSFNYFHDLIQIRNGTPRSMNLSYGMNVFWMALSTFDLKAGSVLKYSIFISTICWMVFCIAVFLNKVPERFRLRCDKTQSLQLDYFRAGAGIYCITFLLGNNWDYRLIFLLFTIPQLLIWRKHEHAIFSRLATLSLIGIFISQWYLVASGLAAYAFAYGENIAYLIDQLVKWFVFFSLSYLLSLSASDFYRGIVNWSQLGQKHH